MTISPKEGKQIAGLEPSFGFSRKSKKRFIENIEYLKGAESIPVFYWAEMQTRVVPFCFYDIWHKCGDVGRRMQNRGSLGESPCIIRREMRKTGIADYEIARGQDRRHFVILDDGCIKVFYKEESLSEYARRIGKKRVIEIHVLDMRVYRAYINGVMKKLNISQWGDS